MNHLLRLLRSEDAATSVEYAVMLALILLAVIAAVVSLGVETSGSYDNSAQQIDQHFNGGGS